MTILIVEDHPDVRAALVALVTHRVRELSRHATIISVDNLDEAAKYLVPGVTPRLSLAVRLSLTALSEAERGCQVVEADNLDDAVKFLAPGTRHLEPETCRVSGVLCDGTFPAFPNDKIPFDSPHNRPRIMWPQVLGYATKRGIPFVLLTGDPDQVEHAQSRGVPAFMKPEGTGAAIQCLLQGSGVRCHGSTGSPPPVRPCSGPRAKVEGRAKSRGVSGKDPDTRNPEPDTCSLDDPRFTNGRRHGCLNPQMTQMRQKPSEKSASSADADAVPDATGHPYGPTEP